MNNFRRNEHRTHLQRPTCRSSCDKMLLPSYRNEERKKHVLDFSKRPVMFQKYPKLPKTISLENCDQKSATKLFTHWHSCHTTHSCSHGPHGGCANCAHGHAHSSHIAWGATHLGTSWATLKNLWQSTESTGIVIPFEETWQQIMAPPEAVGLTPVTMMEIEQPIFSMGWFPLRMG